MPSSFYTLLKKRTTLIVLNFLLGCTGIPMLRTRNQSLCTKYVFCIYRKFSLCFLNLYLAYRIFKLVKNKNPSFDIFPLINAAVSACTVDSFALQCGKFGAFSQSMSDLMQKREVYLSGGTFLKLAVFYAIFVSYVLICATVFPSSASHWFDTSDNYTSETPDLLHLPGVRPFTHGGIFVMCSGNVVLSVMLYCFVCVLLQQVMHSIYSDLKKLKSSDAIDPGSIHEFRTRFIEAANMVHVADGVLSFFGLVGLGCVFSRACACIHFYLNLSPSYHGSTWFFVATQISFDLSALAAICCLAASVSEEARKIPSMVLLLNNRIPPRNVGFHLQCLNLAKVMLTSDVQMTAWKLFPFTRRVLPTVVGVTLSYVTVIIQMHHAASMNFSRQSAYPNATSSVLKYF